MDQYIEKCRRRYKVKDLNNEGMNINTFNVRYTERQRAVRQQKDIYDDMAIKQTSSYQYISGLLPRLEAVAESNTIHDLMFDSSCEMTMIIHELKRYREKDTKSETPGLAIEKATKLKEFRNAETGINHIMAECDEVDKELTAIQVSYDEDKGTRKEEVQSQAVHRQRWEQYVEAAKERMNLAPVGNQTSIVGGKQNDGMDAANGHDKENLLRSRSLSGADTFSGGIHIALTVHTTRQNENSHTNVDNNHTNGRRHSTNQCNQYPDAKLTLPEVPKMGIVERVKSSFGSIDALNDIFTKRQPKPIRSSIIQNDMAENVVNRSNNRNDKVPLPSTETTNRISHVTSPTPSPPSPLQPDMQEPKANNTESESNKRGPDGRHSAGIECEADFNIESIVNVNVEPTDALKRKYVSDKSPTLSPMRKKYTHETSKLDHMFSQMLTNRNKGSETWHHTHKSIDELKKLADRRSIDENVVHQSATATATDQSVATGSTHQSMAIGSAHADSTPGASDFAHSTKSKEAPKVLIDHMTPKSMIGTKKPLAHRYSDGCHSSSSSEIIVLKPVGAVKMPIPIKVIKQEPDESCSSTHLTTKHSAAENVLTSPSVGRQTCRTSANERNTKNDNRNQETDKLSKSFVRSESPLGQIKKRQTRGLDGMTSNNNETIANVNETAKNLASSSNIERPGSVAPNAMNWNTINQTFNRTKVTFNPFISQRSATSTESETNEEPTAKNKITKCKQEKANTFQPKKIGALVAATIKPAAKKVPSEDSDAGTSSSVAFALKKSKNDDDASFILPDDNFSLPPDDMDLDDFDNFSFTSAPDQKSTGNETTEFELDFGNLSKKSDGGQDNSGSSSISFMMDMDTNTAMRTSKASSKKDDTNESMLDYRRGRRRKRQTTMSKGDEEFCLDDNDDFNNAASFGQQDDVAQMNFDFDF